MQRKNTCCVGRTGRTDTCNPKKSGGAHDTESVSLFISYSHKDDELCKPLITHLWPLRRLGLIATWYDRMIEPGSKWDEAIKARLTSADII